MVIDIQSVHSQVCVYIHTYRSQDRDAGLSEEVKKKKKRRALNSACQRNLLACHFGHTRHMFISPGLGFEENDWGFDFLEGQE